MIGSLNLNTSKTQQPKKPPEAKTYPNKWTVPIIATGIDAFFGWPFQQEKINRQALQKATGSGEREAEKDRSNDHGRVDRLLYRSYQVWPQLRIINTRYNLARETTLWNEFDKELAIL